MNPNLQNIPDPHRAGRAHPRAPSWRREGWLLLSADYTQIELRILAHVSERPGLLARLVLERRGSPRAPPPARPSASRSDQVTREQRDIAKMINYGIAYGLSAFGLAQRLGLPGKEAQEIIHRYFARYTGVKAWLDRIVEEARRERTR